MGAAAPQPASRPAPRPARQTAASAPARRPQAETAEVATRGTGDGRPSRATGSTAAALARLTAATVLACGLNGVAGYMFVQSDAVKVGPVVTAQQTSLDTVSRVVGTAPATIRSLRDGERTTTAYTQDLATGASEITSSAARAAGGPAEFAGDVSSLTRLSGAYTTYTGMLEQARTAGTDAAAEKLLTSAATYRSQNIDPLVTKLDTAYATRGDQAELASTATVGFLGATTLASLVALVGGASWLARRTKRVLNPGLLAATVTSAAVSAYAFSTLLTNPPVPNGPWTAPAVLLGGLAAAGLAWAGLEQRRKEYR